MKYSRGVNHIPKIKRFFSGRRFPLATLSSSDDQMFFFEPSLLVGRLFAPGALDPRVGLEDIVCSSPTMRQGGDMYPFPSTGSVERRLNRNGARQQEGTKSEWRRRRWVGERGVVQARAARSGESRESGTKVGEDSFTRTKPQAQGTRNPIQSI